MVDAKGVSLRVTAPVCSFRKGLAREYLETEGFPPPSTLYGFLLAFVGEEDRHAYLGTRLASGLLSVPGISTVLRTVWRVKKIEDKKAGTRQLPGVGTNRRPDFQELLISLDLFVFVDDGPLADRLRGAAANPGAIRRYGGLSLGESRDLVNDIWWEPKVEGLPCRWLVRDPEGDMPLPVWVDHVGSKETVWEQCRLVDGTVRLPAPDSPQWITISGP